MVRVIGKDPEHLHKVTCPKCSSILEYVLSEVTYSSVRDISGCSDEYNYIECPVCTPPAATGRFRTLVEVRGR